MKYILLIHDDEKAWSKLADSDRQKIYGEYELFMKQIKSAGHYLGGNQLQPTSAATSVRMRDGKRLVTDGPFAETHEQLGGFFLIDASDLDQAIAIAARVPSARAGTIEVRPIVESGAQATL
jgi:hypothetical protein